MHVLEEISKERERQILKGFDAQHDDQHDNGEILEAAVKIATGVAMGDVTFATNGAQWTGELAQHVCEKWDDKKRLIIAAAMIVAEIERMERAGL